MQRFAFVPPRSGGISVDAVSHAAQTHTTCIGYLFHFTGFAQIHLGDIGDD